MPINTEPLPDPGSQPVTISSSFALLRAIGRRLALSLSTLFIVSIVIFSAITFLPGDFTTAVLGQTATPEAVAAFQKDLGLDKPAPLRYLDWLGGAVVGDFGYSFSSGVSAQRKVATIIANRLTNTAFLAAVSTIITVPLALLLGILSALYRNSWFDKIANVTTLTGVSFPEFFTGYILMLFLSVKFPIFPSLSDFRSDAGLLSNLQSIALPVLTLTLVVTAHMMRMTRSAIINVLSSSYVEMAQIKGASSSRVILWHALPNAWAPIATVVAFNMAYLIVGVVVVEIVFVYPGIGQTMMDAIRIRDIPVIQACALIFAAIYICVNLLADLIGIVTNPRLLYPR